MDASAAPVAICMADHVAPKLRGVFAGRARYRAAYGGRGSGKSSGFAAAAIVRALEGWRGQTPYGAANVPFRVLCGREIQNTIRDSVHQELTIAIDRLGLGGLWEVGESFIRSKDGRAEFVFKGLSRSLDEIKGLAGLGLVWLDEAESLSPRSIEILIPTVRAGGSEIWFTWNPKLAGSVPDLKFVQELGAFAAETSTDGTRLIWFDERATQTGGPPDARVTRLNWRDNPWFPDVLERERRIMARTDPDRYQHVWEGGYLVHADAQVLRGKWVVEEFEPGADWEGPFFGADWGFSVDPTVLVRCWIYGRVLYLDYSPSWAGLEIEDTAARFLEVPLAARRTIFADCSRPETISHVARVGGLDVRPAEKWPGSVEDGVNFLRSFERIVIHPRCESAITEATLWAYKMDRQTGKPLSVLAPGNDHVWDAVRYALSEQIRNAGGPIEFEGTGVSRSYSGLDPWIGWRGAA